MNDGKFPCLKCGLFYMNEEVAGKQFAGWYRDYFCPFTQSVTDLIKKEIGKENIDGILLCGSFATGEGSVVLSSKGTLFLSDVDIVVAVNSLSIHQHILPGKRKLGDECEKLWRDAKFRGRVNIGIYHLAELSSLTPSPGVYDMKRKGLVLFGRKEFTALFPSYKSNDITSEEVVRLMENRIVAHLGAHRLIHTADLEDRLELIYEVSRVYTDMLVGAMIVAGKYRSGYYNRLTFLKKNRDNQTLLKLIPPDMLKKMEKWTRLKLDPSSCSEVEINSKRMWEESATDLLRYWKLFQSAKPQVENKKAVEDFLESRKSKYTLLVRLKLWRNYLKRFSMPLRIVRIINLGKNLYKSSPEELLMEYGVRLLHCRIEKGEKVHIKSLSGGFPYDSSEWSKAAEKLYSHWVKFVSG